MSDKLAVTVRERAGFVCEYCRLPDWVEHVPFELEHIIPRQHDGPTALDNLAYACLHCNRHKGPNLSGIDRQSLRLKVVQLFNPRLQRWTAHFAWDGLLIVGRTPAGRATVAVLKMNDRAWVSLREQMLDEGWNPDE